MEKWQKLCYWLIKKCKKRSSIFSTNARANVSICCKVLQFFCVNTSKKWLSVGQDWERWTFYFTSSSKFRWLFFFFAFLLPEVVTRKNDLSSDNKQKHYCICQMTCFKPMIACDKPGCEVEWCYYVRMSITRAPNGSWICPKCKGHSIT